MLSHGGFTQCNSLSQNPISTSLFYPKKPQLKFAFNQVSHHKSPSFHAKIRTGFCVFASKTPTKLDKTLFQVEEIDDDDEEVLAEMSVDSAQKQTAKEGSRRDVSVRLRNLPRKKNIKRDLRAAFKEFPGILNIVPAVNGNKKTKEPSCKGHAFVYFKSQNEANRFVELFSGQILTFGKIQQKISCVVVNPSSPNDTDKHADNKLVLPLLPLDPSSEDQNPQLSTNSEDTIDEKLSKIRLCTGILDNFTSM